MTRERSPARYAHPLFVTPHAVLQWRRRVGPASAAAIMATINAAFVQPVWWRDAGERTNLLVVRQRPLILVAVVPATEPGRWPVVTTTLAGSLSLGKRIRQRAQETA